MRILYLTLICSFLQFAYADCNKESGNDLSYILKTDEHIKLVQNQSSSQSSNQLLIINTDERRGCCSWHQGVCGCSNGRAVCCDGSYSPTCGCD